MQQQCQGSGARVWPCVQGCVDQEAGRAGAARDHGAMAADDDVQDGHGALDREDEHSVAERQAGLKQAEIESNSNADMREAGRLVQDADS